jgi:hypothetical protein
MNKKQNRRPIEHTFLLWEQRFPDPSVLSLRKQFCYYYLLWKCRQHKHLKQAWVDAAVAMRKGENKIGGKRTKLEKLARRHFQDRRRFIGCEPSRNAAKEHGVMQRDNGIGIHTDEMREKQKEIAREWMRKRGEENNHPGTRDWVITYKPTGKQFVIRNLTAFCREHNINYRNLHFTAVSNYWAKGFRARKFDELIDSGIPSREEYEKEHGRVTALVKGEA